MRPQKPNAMQAPGLAFRQRKEGWNLYWTAQGRIVKRGFLPSTVRLWPATEAAPEAEPTPEEWIWIAGECQRLQAAMLKWSRGGVDDPRSRFNGTLGTLIEIYLTDPDCEYQELRHQIQCKYAQRLARLKNLYGHVRISDLTFRDFKRWHAGFRDPGNKVAMAHAMMALVRAVLRFGKKLRLDPCAQLVDDLSEMKFTLGRRRREFITAAQVVAFRTVAHREGRPSLALAMAFQFELGIRQKDVIGEWIPLAEPGMSEISDGHKKWLHGLHWKDVDQSMTLRKRISKSLRGRNAVMSPDAGDIQVYDLTAYPMVMEELQPRRSYIVKKPKLKPAGYDPTESFDFPDLEIGLDKERSVEVPFTGPMIICEGTGRPWRFTSFEHEWRRIADLAGIPRTIQNRDSRAGAITEGRKAGASLEDLRHQAGHSDIKMTARYDRPDVETKSKVAQLRIRSRER